MMGGDVTVHSVAGEGSVFTIKLPAAVSEVKTDGVTESIPGKSMVAITEQGIFDGTETSAGTCVLVVDDDATQREVIQRFLTKEGFSVRTAAGGQAGLQMARQLRPVAITLDVMMPEMDGWSVLLALKADPDLRDIPVVMVTMVDDPQRGFALGASDYATKPVDRARLSQILKKYTCPNPPCPVLLVDDDPMVREVTRAILEKEGWRVREAENGRVALECMQQESGQA